jgi:hypothetical protein
LKDLPTPRNDAMSQPPKIYLSAMPSGGLAVFSGSIFGGDRMQPADPRKDLRARLSRMTPGDRAAMLSLVRQLGASELTSHFERLSGWTH